MNQLRYDRKIVLVALAWVGMLSVATAVFWPGLVGPFLFDDFGSLARLGELGGVTDWRTFKAFVFEGTTGPTGRPLSLFSFLLDGSTWPTDSWPFKRTNLVIHLLSGSLLVVAVIKIIFISNGLRALSAREYWVVVAVASTWLLHPFLISTTFYIVQRMAQLSALFCFAGLVGYLHGRALIRFLPVRGYVWMSMSIGLGTLLALFSKENGILLPALILVVEFTVVASRTHECGSLNKAWYVLFLVLPSLAIIAYLSRFLWGGAFFEQIASREYSIYERLLTESRILFDYLRHWFLPELYTAGLFHDNYSKSTGFFAPWTTFVAVVSHLLILMMAIIKRKQWPLFSFAVLFFYVAHLVESTVVPLELYFEHRNYLAVSFLFLPVFYLLISTLSTWGYRLCVVVVLVILSGFSYYSATIWSSYPSMALAWAQKSPNSSRAQQQASLELFNQGHYESALDVLDRSTLRMPADLELRVWKIIVSCKLNQLERRDVDIANRLAKELLYDLRTIKLYRLYVETIAQRSCKNLTFADGVELFDSMLEYAGNADKKSASYSHIQYLSGDLAVYYQQPRKALAHYYESLQARPGAGHAMHMAAFVATEGYWNEALLLSDRALYYLDHAGADNKGEVLLEDVVRFQKQVRLELSLNGV